jgi:glycosyltransferase involved in cell wall biosynthesis
MSSFTFHCFVNPHVPCNSSNLADAFNQFAIKFAEMMTTNGHEVFFYSNSKEQVTCTEFIPVLCEKDYIEIEREAGVSFNDGLYLVYSEKSQPIKNIIQKEYNKKTIEELKTRLTYKENEFFFHFYNLTTQEISQAYPYVKNVEMMMGCYYSFCKNVIFASTNFCRMSIETMNKSPEHHDVIPPIFKRSEFTYKNKKNGVILYLGRIQLSKGVGTVFELASLMPNVKFWIAGKGTLQNNILYIPSHDINSTCYHYDLSLYPNVTYLGFADLNKRRELLSDCSALIQPSQYQEPFGFNIIEAYLSGTPVITTNTGSFLEIVKNNITGYQCNHQQEFIDAINKIIQGKIKPYNCLNQGLKYEINNKSLYKKYLKFFKDSLTI